MDGVRTAGGGEVDMGEMGGPGGSSVGAQGPYGRLRALDRARLRGEDAAGNHPDRVGGDVGLVG